MAGPGHFRDYRSDLRPGRIALAYATISLAWIFGSGLLVQSLSSGPLAGFLETAKGTGYVLVVTVGLYIILRHRAAAIRNAEAAREAADAARLRLAAVVEQSSEAIVVATPDWKLFYVNPAMEHATGYDRAELIGEAAGRFLTDADGSSMDTGVWPRVDRDGAWRGILLARCKDGSALEIDAVLGRILDAGGATSGFFGILRDVSHERALERQLAEAGRMEAVGQLAGGIAHDFNNLLTAISGYAELLTAETSASTTARADVEEIQRASKSAAGLVRQLLALGRRQVLAPSALALDDLVEQLRPMLGGLLGPRIWMEIRCPKPLDPVFADAGQIEQVLVNLTVNARDAMPDGGKLWIDLANARIAASNRLSALVPPGRYVTVSVVDTGHGMDRDTLSRVFEPFFTTKPAGKGTGLGLASAYGIVKQSGGYMLAESQPGKGATFTLYLPRFDAAESQLDRPKVVKAADPSPTGHETVLVIEDDDAIRTLVTQTLGRLGYRVLAGSNAAEAIAHARGDGPLPLLVTDIRLPGVDGPTIAARLKATHPGMRVLYVSGYAGETMVNTGVLGEDEAFLAKPFSSDDLARRVRDMLDAGRRDGSRRTAERRGTPDGMGRPSRS